MAAAGLATLWNPAIGQFLVVSAVLYQLWEVAQARRHTWLKQDLENHSSSSVVMHCAILQAGFSALILCKFGGSLVKLSTGIVNKKWPVREIAIAISTQWPHTEITELLTWHVEESYLQGRPNLPIRFSQTYKSCHFRLRCCASFSCCPTVCFCDFLLKGKLALLSTI